MFHGRILIEWLKWGCWDNKNAYIWAMANKVKVSFPGGRSTWLDPKTADTKTVRRMGGRVIEAAPIPEVPKVYAKPITEPIVDPVADNDDLVDTREEEGFAELNTNFAIPSEKDFAAPAPKEAEPKAVKAAPKKMGRPKKAKA